MIRRGKFYGPLILTWVAIGGGFDAANPYTMMNFIRQVPDGAVPRRSERPRCATSCR